MHTMAKVKNLLLDSGEQPEPRRREDGEQRIVDGAARLIANTGTEAAELVSHYGADIDHIDVAPPGVDLDVFTPAFRGRSRAAHGVPPGRFHLLFAGRIQRLKGPQILVKAAALLRARRPDIDLQLTILGRAQRGQGLRPEALISAAGMDDVVTHHPPVSAPELAGWFRSADVVVMPSYSESFGLVALEAQACGTPVVATKVGGLSRAIFHGRTGMLVEGHNAADWADALEALYDDPPPGRTWAGRRRSRPGFGWQRTAAITLESYHTAVSQYLRKPDHPGGPHALSWDHRPDSGLNHWPANPPTPRAEGQRCLKTRYPDPPPPTPAAAPASLSDLEIAQQAAMRPIEDIAAAAGINADALEPYGRYKAKIDPANSRFAPAASPRPGKVVLVSAMSPTPAGEGKSTTTVGLADSLARAGTR